MGRPSTYGSEIAASICEQISLGSSLRAICRQDGYPNKTTVLRWLHAHEEFRDHYARARLEQADTYAEQMQEIAEDAEDPRLQVDVLKWKVARMHPRGWGDRQVVDLTGDLNANVNIQDARDSLKGKLDRIERLSNTTADEPER